MEKDQNLKEIGWEFPIEETNAIEGLSGQIEHFLNNPLFSLAKESAQNSLDARLNNKKPVILEFESFYIEKRKVPDCLGFDKILREIIKFWKITKKDKRVELFVENAKKILNHYKILCLRISDFNTTGLDGAKQENISFTGWNKLVKYDTVSDNNPLAGGSFGLGKNSTFACSDLRMVIYSTRDTEGFEAYQGVANLASNYNEDGKYTHRKGYYGKIKNYSNIKEKFNLDNSFNRKEPGTDVYILGFDNSEDNWKDKIICSIMHSFLLALYEGNLIFKFEGKQLDKESLKDFIEKYRSDQYKSIVDKTLFDYYDILEGNINSTEYTFSILEKNDVFLKVALEAGLNNKISMNRSNGMKIFDKSRLRGVEDCAGILVLKGDKLNAYLRNLEDPKHDKWYPERFRENPKEASKILKLLYHKINESIKKMSQEDNLESLDPEGMGEYLPDDFDNDLKKRKPIEDIPWDIATGVSIVKKRDKTKIEITGKGGGKGKGKNDGSGGDNSNKGPGEDSNIKIKKIIEANSIRAFSNKNRIYKLIFSIPEESSSLKADILISGEDGNRKILLIDEAKLVTKKYTKNLKCTDNKIFIGKVSKNKIVNIEFELKDSEKWALEVSFYED